MSERNNLALIADLYAAFARGDLAAIVAACDPEVRWGFSTVVKDVPWLRTFEGREGVAEFFATMHREIDTEQFRPHAFASSGEFVSCLVEYSETVKRTGKRVSGIDSHHFELRDGKIVAWRGHTDTAAYSAAYRAEPVS